MEHIPVAPGASVTAIIYQNLGIFDVLDIHLPILCILMYRILVAQGRDEEAIKVFYLLSFRLS